MNGSNSRVVIALVTQISSVFLSQQVYSDQEENPKLSEIALAVTDYLLSTCYFNALGGHILSMAEL